MENKATITIGAKDETKAGFGAVERSLQKLQLAAASTGKSASEVKLLQLAMQGASKSQLEAADSALKLTDGYAGGVRLGNQFKAAALEVGKAAAIGLGAAVVAFELLIGKAAQFQDLAETTGASAEGIASIAVAAATAGVSIDSVASAMIKLTKNLTGVDDDSKAAGAALVAIGINVSDFKKLDPVGQFDAISKALAGFADGAGKTAFAVAAFGKTGAEQLKVFKAVEEQGGRQIILTAEQIRQADDYKDAQARSRTQLLLYASSIATQALPAVTAFTGALTDVAKELLGVDTEARNLAGSSAVPDFAESAARAIASLADTAFAVAQGFNVVGSSIGAAAAIAAAVADGNIAGALAIKDAAREQGDAMKFTLGLADKLEKRFADMRAGFSRGIKDSELDSFDTAAPKKKINFNGAAKTGGTLKDDSAQIAKAQLTLDIDLIRKASGELTDVYANSEKILEANRAAGLAGEAAYYLAKKSFINLETVAKEDALQKEIARLQQEQLSGKDKLENDKKILDAESKLGKLRQDAAASGQVLGIQQQAALSRVASSYLSAQQAAQDYFDTIQRQQARALADVGAGTKQRSFSAGVNQIEDRYTGQRRDLENNKSQLELEGKFTEEARAQYEQRLALINDFQDKSLLSYDAYFAALTATEGNWALGATEAMRNYADETQNIFKQVEQITTNAFKGMEDALVSFVTTGKLDFTSLANSIIADIARIIVKQALASAFSSGSSGGSSTVSTLSLLGSVFGGGRATGGPVSAGGLYEVNERGPELLNMAGKQYLMMGSQDGSVTPNGGAAMAGDTIHVTQNFTVGDVASISMVRQAVAGSEGRIAAALGRSQRYAGALA